MISYAGSDLKNNLEFITDKFPSKMFNIESNIEHMIIIVLIISYK